MKKIISGIILVIVANATVFAFTSVKIMKGELDKGYSQLIIEAKDSYNNYMGILYTEKKSLNTGDYRVLGILTGLSMDNLFVSARDGYKDVFQYLTDNKYSIISQIDILDAKFQSKLIGTGDYKVQMDDLEKRVDNFPQVGKKYIDNFKNNLDGQIVTFKDGIKTKLNKLSSEVNVYKNFEQKLGELNRNYDIMNKKSDSIKNIVGVSKNLLDKTSNEIKIYADNYFSGYIEGKYKKQVESDPDFKLFNKERKDKKELLFGFITQKVSGIISEVTENYYPNIDTQTLVENIDVINSLNVKDVVKNSKIYLDKIKNTNNTILDYTNKLSNKLSKFSNTSIDKNKVADIVKKDVMNGINNISPIVDQELQSTFSSWTEQIQQKEKNEKSYMNKALVSYNEKMSKGTIQSLESLKYDIQSYKNFVSLPSNISILDSYVSSADIKLEQVRNQYIIDSINELYSKAKGLDITSSSDISNLSNEVSKLDGKIKFQSKINEIKLEIKLKENLNELYKAGAIRYYYNYGDLSDTVRDILKKYYNKYEAKGKENIFDNKITSASTKIEKYMNELSNDRRSYYIIMIYNGLLKFNSEK